MTWYHTSNLQRQPLKLFHTKTILPLHFYLFYISLFSFFLICIMVAFVNFLINERCWWWWWFSCCLAVARLKSAGVPIRLCSNTSTRSPLSVAHTLTSLGFDISPDEVFTPIPAVKQYLRQNMLRPFVIVDPGELLVLSVDVQLLIYFLLS